MTVSPTSKPQVLVAHVLLALLISNSQLAYAVDDIDQPAGEVGDYYYDESAGNDPAMVDIPADGSEANTDSVKSEAESEDDSGQIGPVWESYNSNMKSVAQEVTKGLRVEDVVEPPTEYHYAAFGKPDPFVPPMITMRDQDVATVSSLEVPIVSPLQAHDLSALSVVGIWQLSSGERKALVMAPPSQRVTGGTAQGIIVRNGDPIGKNGGKILAIGETFLTVREFRLAVDGTRQYEDVTMQMGVRDGNSGGKIRFVPGEDSTTIIPEGNRTSVNPMLGAPPASPVASGAPTAPAINGAPAAARLLPAPQTNQPAALQTGQPAGQGTTPSAPAAQPAALPGGAAAPAAPPAAKAPPAAMPAVPNNPAG